MQKDAILTNILSITGAGLLIFLTGISFVLFRDFISKYIRFFLTLPPIGVAAYIFVYNLYQHYEGEVTTSIPVTIKEVLIGVGVVSVSFAAFAALLILFINTIRKMI
jgi:hypothetical protein